ncbi:MAG: toprim domain-containing protein [Tannerellaceae bacterium]|nr:toprim domain-containing protein [Tannerellaceae bacterium]
MNSKNAKSISLLEYLSALGHHPTLRQSDNYWYLSPLREEKTPSFKVSRIKNLWYDFGLAKGGTIIDFTLLYYKITEVKEALRKIEEKTDTLSSISFSFQKPVSTFKIQQLKPIENKVLIEYLTERGIPLSIAREHIEEIYFSREDKTYFALGFENRSGGYELRNKYFKGCLPPKDITIIQNGSDTCNVFEGFINYLSYLTIKAEIPAFLPSNDPEDHLILNSVQSLSKALKPLTEYPTIICYPDNDNAGKKAVEELKKHFPNLQDNSFFYKEENDLNDYLCKAQRHQKKEEQSRKPVLRHRRRLR